MACIKDVHREERATVMPGAPSFIELFGPLTVDGWACGIYPQGSGTRPIIGVAPPPGMGRVPSGPPNVFGGNMDNRDLGPGSTLYLPVHTPGALLSIGDGHAAQGYGEVCLSAIETSLKGEIQVVLHKGTHLRWPRAETPTHYMTMGLHTDLHEATKIATREMLDFLVQAKGLSRDDAYMLASVAMDLVVTQVVDGTQGIHALLPKAIFTQ